jgi:hypothetical protein
MLHRRWLDIDVELDETIEQRGLSVQARFTQAGLPFPSAFKQPEPRQRP